MTLTIRTEEDERRQLKVEVEVAEPRVQQAMQAVARRLSREVNIPGFRKGKVPYRIIVNRFGESAIRAEAVEDLIDPVFREALDEIEFDPYAPATFDDVAVDPLVLTFTLPLKPEIELGAYRDIRQEVPEVTVEDEAVAEALKRVQERHQVLEPVDRPVESGDVVTVSGKGIADDEEEAVIFEEERVDLIMDGEKVYYGQPFVDQLIGRSVGDSVEFTIELPVEEDEDEEDVETAAEEALESSDSAEETDGDEEEARKAVTATFKLDVLEVKRRELPELDDELAREEGDYETLDELRTSLRENLEQSALDQAKSDLVEAFIDQVLENATMVYPPAAVDMELDEMIEGFKQQVTQSGWRWEDYLQLNTQSEDDLREEWSERAETRLERGLVIHQFITNEKLRIEDSDLEAAVEEQLARFDNEQTKSYMRDWLTGDAGRNMLGNDILMDKIYDRIVAIYQGEAPDLSQLESEDEEE